MTFNHAFRTARSVTLAAAALSLCGCATLFHRSHPVEEPVYPAAATTSTAAPEVQLTATEAAIQADERSEGQAVTTPAPTAEAIKASAPTRTPA